jgi:hypothetical protein
MKVEVGDEPREQLLKRPQLTEPTGRTPIGLDDPFDAVHR